MGFFSSLFKGPESKKLKISQPIPHPGQNTIRPGDLKTLAMLRQEQAQEERARIAKRKATPVSSKIATSFDQLLDNAGSKTNTQRQEHPPRLLKADMG
jgi:hypothetical protein